jgi:hypothetical protein
LALFNLFLFEIGGLINWSDVNYKQSLYKPIDGYKQSKLAMILGFNGMSDHLKTTGREKIRIYLVSPGIVWTNLGRHRLGKITAALAYPFLWLLLKSARQGCECTCYCALATDLEPKNGFYFRNCKQIELTPNAKSQVDSKRMYELSINWLEKWLN